MKVLGSADQKNSFFHGHCTGKVNVTVYCSEMKYALCFLKRLFPSISVVINQ